MKNFLTLVMLFAILATCPACETESKMEAQTKPTIEFASDLDSETLGEYVVALTDNAQNENEIVSRDKPENGGLGIVIRVQTNFDFETEEAWSLEWGS